VIGVAENVNLKKKGQFDAKEIRFLIFVFVIQMKNTYIDEVSDNYLPELNTHKHQ
jgi:hypothetical protein